MAVPYTFANVAGGTMIELSELDDNFNTPITLAGVVINLGDSVSALVLLEAIGAYPASNPNGYNTGTVTSVSGSGSVSGITLTGNVTTSGALTLGGTLAVTPSNFASQSANAVLAAPNGVSGVPSFRMLVPADFGSQSASNVLIAPSGTAGTPTFRALEAADFGSQAANSVLVAPNGTAGAPTFRALLAADIPALNYVVPGGALGTPASGTLDNCSGSLSNCTVNGTDKIGYLTIPQNIQSNAYELILSDSGKHIYHPSTDTTARTWTIPANSAVPFPIGTAITMVNDTSAGAITIAITSDTLVFSPAGTTGSRTLAANGMATILKIGTTRWMISGVGLT